jgi:hypothetical protein
MRRRKLLVALAGMAVVVAAGIVVLWPGAPSRITHENFAILKNGMSQKEVETILGPPGDYTMSPLGNMGDVELREDESGEQLQLLGENDPGIKVHHWVADTGIIEVCFDREGRSFSERYAPIDRSRQSFLEILLWRAKRQWHRWFPE